MLSASRESERLKPFFFFFTGGNLSYDILMSIANDKKLWSIINTLVFLFLFF
jgi:hypothetical protein